MRGVLSSPRRRRRLTWIGSLAGVVGVGVAVVLLLPESKQTAGPTADEGPAQLAAPQVHLTAADRRRIDQTLDRFIPAAVLRKSPATAWALAGPELKSSSSLADWRAGTSPVPYYPARGTTFHDWTTIDVTRNSVVLNLLLHPKPGSKLGSYVFSGQVVRHGSGWLVNRWYTIAIMSPVRGSKHEIGPADFGAPQASGTPQSDSKRGIWWLLPALGILALAPLVLAGFGIRGVLRARRWRRDLVAAGRTELPPLPRRSPD